MNGSKNAKAEQLSTLPDEEHTAVSGIVLSAESDLKTSKPPTLQSVDNCNDDETTIYETLFKGLSFFLAREVPREPLLFVIRLLYLSSKSIPLAIYLTFVSKRNISLNIAVYMVAMTCNWQSKN